MVAIWFAALFGLCSLVLPTALPEHIITLTGVDALIPAMAPPLGLKARFLIALAATVVGGIGGLALARRIGAAQHRNRQSGTAAGPRLRNADRHPDAPARHPISALEELGEDKLPEFRKELAGELGAIWAGELPEKGGRRRSLTNLTQPASEQAQADTYQEWVPAPADEAIELASADLLASPAEEAFQADNTPPEPIEYSASADDEILPQLELPAVEDGSDGRTAEGADNLAPEVSETAYDADENGKPRVDPDPTLRQASLDNLGVTDLVERLAYAIQNRQEPPVAFSEAILASKALAQNWPGGLDQSQDPEGFEEDYDASHAMPAALRPYSFDEEEDEDGIETSLALSDLGLDGHSTQDHRETHGFGDLTAYQAEDFANESDADDEDDSALAEESYSSLLNLNMGPGRAVPIEDLEEPEEADDSERSAEDLSPKVENTDEALREALARLQRFGGG